MFVLTRLSAGAALILAVSACAHGAPPAHRSPAGSDSLRSARVPSARALPLAWGPVAPVFREASRVRPFAVLHQRVTLSYDRERRLLTGTTTLRLRARGDAAVDTILLDAAGMRVRAARDARGALAHSLSGDSLAIELRAPLVAGSTRDIRVDYEVERPREGVTVSDRPALLWTRGGANSARHWVPTVDEPTARATWELIVRARPHETVRASGRLVRRTRARGIVDWRFAIDEAVPASRIGFAVGELAVVSDTSAAPVLALWHGGESAADARRALARMRRTLGALSARLGSAAPWATAELVALSGGADEWSAPALAFMSADSTVVPEWARPRIDADTRLARAATAQWFGLAIPAESAADAWLSDALASALAEELAAPSADDVAWRRASGFAAALARERGTRLPLARERASPVLEALPDDQRTARGVAVVRMLRETVGDSAFSRGLREYARRFRGRPASAQDFRAVLEAESGVDLDGFFTQWVRGSGHPAFAIRWAHDQSARRLTVVVRQVQPRDSLTGRFDAAVDLEAHFTDGSRARRWRIDVGADSASFAFASVPPLRWLTWDAGDRLLDLSDLPRSTLMLAEQLRWDADVTGRRSALAGLRDRMDEPLAVRAVEHALRADVFWGIRQAAIAMLAARADTLARNALLDATNDPDARVREDAVRALATFPGEPTVARLRIVTLTDPSMFVRAAAFESYATLDPRRATPDIRDALARDSWHDVLRAGALRALVRVDVAAAWETARAHLGERSSSWARRAALDVLLAHRQGRDADLALLLDPLLTSRDGSVRAAAIDALAALRMPGVSATLLALRDTESDTGVLLAIERALASIDPRGVGSR